MDCPLNRVLTLSKLMDTLGHFLKVRKMKFADNVWWTRKARIQTEKRLLSNAFQSQILLFWYSFASVAVSIYHLKFATSTTKSEIAGISWVIYSVLVLCISCFINGLSFKERAGLIKECYETLNDFYQKLRQDDADVNKLSSEYNQVLGVCENHTDNDYYRALCEVYLTTNDSRFLDRLPSKYHWFRVIKSKLGRGCILIFFYLLPILLFIVLEMKW